MPTLNRRQRIGHAKDLYLQELRALYNHAREVPDPDSTQFDEPDAWRKVRNDPDISASIDKSLTLTAGLDWEYKPASDRPADILAADIMTDLTKEISHFHEARKQLATGDFRASAWGFVSGARQFRTVLDSMTPRNWWVPTAIRPVDKFRFRLVRTDEGKIDEPIKTDWMIGNILRGDFSFLGANEEAYIVHTHAPAEDTLGHGRGILEDIFTFWRIKEGIIAKQALAIRRWAAGFIEVEIDEEILSSEDSDPSEIVAKTLDEIEIMRTEDALVHGKGQKWTIHDWPAQGGAMFEKMYNILQKAIDRRILSSVLPTGGGGEVGSLSRADQEADQMDSTMQARSGCLSESVDDRMAVLIWKRNRQQIQLELEARSLPAAKRPKFQIIKKAIERPLEDLDRLKKAQDLGFPITEKMVSDAGHIPIPGSGEKVLTAPVQAPQGPAPFEANPTNGNTHFTARR